MAGTNGTPSPFPAINPDSVCKVSGKPLPMKPKRHGKPKLKRFAVLEEVATVEAADRDAAVAHVVKSFSLTRVLRIEEIPE